MDFCALQKLSENNFKPIVPFIPLTFSIVDKTHHQQSTNLIISFDFNGKQIRNLLLSVIYLQKKLIEAVRKIGTRTFSDIRKCV